MAGLQAAEPQLALVRRVITRPPGLGGETYEAIDAAEFQRRTTAGDFCLHWPAHGLHYGIPAGIVHQAEVGQDFLVNLSRSVLTDAARIFPDFVVLNLTARPETLVSRLAGRGRESLADIRNRLDRRGASMPPGLRIIDISNDGSLGESVRMAREGLAREVS